MASHTYKASLLICIAILATSLVSAQKVAGDYLELIGKEFGEIQSRTWEYTRTVAHDKGGRKVEKTRKDVVLATTAAMRRIGNMKPFNGDSKLRDSALSFLKVNHAVINEDYAKLMDMEEIAEQSYDNMEAYMTAREKANDKLHAAGQMVGAEYARFAADNNIRLIDDNSRIAKNMEIAGKVYDHYNEVYLVFFKSYKQEAYLLSAMDKNDVNGIEQNRATLAKFSTEGLEKLKTFQPYAKDQSLIKACQQLLEFYKDESENKLSGVSSLYVAKDNFEKLKTNFDNKPADKRTREDVDQFNQAVANYNKTTEDFNRLNNELNNKRNVGINNWNNTCDRFTDRHIPNR
jgi:hypothetical protein